MDKATVARHGEVKANMRASTYISERCKAVVLVSNLMAPKLLGGEIDETNRAKCGETAYNPYPLSLLKKKATLLTTRF